MPVRVNTKLAEWVEEVKGNLSTRQVEIKAGISYATVSAMLNGRTPSAETIIRFARAFGKDVPAALRLAGYEDIAEMWESGAAPVVDETWEKDSDSDASLLAEAERMGFHQDLKDWERLSDADRENLRGIIRRMLGEDRGDPRDRF